MKVEIKGVKHVKKIRKGPNADEDDKGRECAYCGKEVLWGNSMYSVNARDGEFRTSEHLCEECHDKNDLANMIETVWQRRIDFARSIPLHKPTF